MKNLFDYATKELSQDAFLRWFIENDYRGSGKELLSAFTGVDPKRITDIKTWGQSEHIDICIDFKVDSKPHVLIIEDKVNTSEHSNQLDRYKTIVKKWNNNSEEYKDRPSHFIFYKPRILKREEKAYIESKGWKVFDLTFINKFFKDYVESDNLIIKQYAEYISGLNKDSTNDKLPVEHRILAWKSFFERKVKPLFDKTNLEANVGETFYGYAYLNLTLKNCDSKKVPYLEIRSRDCLNKSIVGRILIYDIDISKEQIEGYKIAVRAFGKYFHPENNSKQIASTHRRNKESICFKNQEDYIAKIIELAKEYLSISLSSPVDEL